MRYKSGSMKALLGSVASRVGRWLRSPLFWGVILFGAGVVVVVAVARYDASGPSVTSGPREVNLAFGLSREPITRSVLLNLCADDEVVDDAQGHPECSGKADRPAVISAGLVSDLAPKSDGGTGQQFPTSQLAVVASNEGTQGLRIAVKADPLEPERISDGTYAGELVVQRERPDPPISVSVTASLKPREGKTVLLAFGALLLGSLIGTFVKWINDVYAPLAGLRRRQRRLERRLRPGAGLLPTDVEELFDEIRVSIRSVDSEGVPEALDLLASARPDLSAFAAAIRELRREIIRQRKLIKQIGPSAEAFEDVLSDEESMLEALRERTWPWSNGAEVTSAYESLKQVFKANTEELRGLTTRQSARADVDDTAERMKNRLASAPTVPQPAGSQTAPGHAEIEGGDLLPHSESSSRTRAASHEPTAMRRRVIEVLLDNSRGSLVRAQYRPSKKPCTRAFLLHRQDDDW